MKWMIGLFVLILVSSVVFAANNPVPVSNAPNITTAHGNSSGNNESPSVAPGGPQSNESGNGQQVQTEQETENQGEERNLTIRIQEKLRARNVSELKEMIQERKQEMNQELKNLTKSEEKVYQNQNAVRLAVHTLLAMENLTGGIGKNVSQIAREFNNSVQATINAEERIENRGSFVRLFFGGDSESAEAIEKEINQNRLRIQEIKRLRDECNCSEEIKAIIQEQVQSMEQEQNRLQELAQSEKKSKGLFGWLFR